MYRHTYLCVLACDVFNSLVISLVALIRVYALKCLQTQSLARVSSEDFLLNNSISLLMGVGVIGGTL